MAATLYSAYPSAVMRGIFSGASLLCLGNAAGEEFAVDTDRTDTAGTNYARQSGADAAFSHSVADGRATVINNGKVYWPTAVASYPAPVASLLIRAPFRDYDIQQNSSAADYDETEATFPVLFAIPLTNALQITNATRAKMNVYVAGSGRGMKAQLWLPTGG